MTLDTQSQTTSVPFVIHSQAKVPAARLVVRNELGQITQQWLVNDSKVTLGSSPNAALQCRLPGVAPYHVLLVVGAQQSFVRALAPKLSRDGVPVNELLLSSENSSFEIAGHLFELSRDVAVQNRKDPAQPPQRLKFTLARPLELSQRALPKPSVQSSAPEQPITSQQVSNLVHNALEPLEAQIQSILKPLTQLQQQAAAHSGADDERKRVQQVEALLDANAGDMDARLARFAASQSAAMDVVGERISDVNMQLSSLEQIIAENTRSDTLSQEDLQVRESRQAQAISGLQNGFSHLNEAVQSLQNRAENNAVDISRVGELVQSLVNQQGDVESHDITWRTAVQQQVGSLRDAINQLAVRTEQGLSNLAAQTSTLTLQGETQWHEAIQDQLAGVRQSLAEWHSQTEGELQQLRQQSQTALSGAQVLSQAQSQLQSQVAALHHEIAGLANAARQPVEEDGAISRWRETLQEQVKSLRQDIANLGAAQSAPPSVDSESNARDEAWRVDVQQQLTVLGSSLTELSSRMESSLSQLAESNHEGPAPTSVDEDWKQEIQGQFHSLRAAIDAVANRPAGEPDSRASGTDQTYSGLIEVENEIWETTPNTEEVSHSSATEVEAANPAPTQEIAADYFGITDDQISDSQQTSEEAPAVADGSELSDEFAEGVPSQELLSQAELSIEVQAETQTTVDSFVEPNQEQAPVAADQQEEEEVFFGFEPTVEAAPASEANTWADGIGAAEESQTEFVDTNPNAESAFEPPLEVAPEQSFESDQNETDEQSFAAAATHEDAEPRSEFVPAQPESVETTDALQSPDEFPTASSMLGETAEQVELPEYLSSDTDAAYEDASDSAQEADEQRPNSEETELPNWWTVQENDSQPLVAEDSDLRIPGDNLGETAEFRGLAAAAEEEHNQWQDSSNANEDQPSYEPINRETDSDVSAVGDSPEFFGLGTEADAFPREGSESGDRAAFNQPQYASQPSSNEDYPEDYPASEASYADPVGDAEAVDAQPEYETSSSFFDQTGNEVLDSAPSTEDFSAAGYSESEQEVQEQQPSIAEQFAAEAQDSDSDEDASVEEYMNKLLARMRGGDTAPPPAQEPEKPTLSAEAAREADLRSSLAELQNDNMEELERQESEIEKLANQEDFSPRINAPEKVRNLAAMRELANTSARSAISKSTRKRNVTNLVINIATAGLGITMGGTLLLINGLEVNIPFILALVAFAVAGIAGYETLRTLMPIWQTNRILKSVEDTPRAAAAASPTSAQELPEEPTSGIPTDPLRPQ